MSAPHNAPEAIVNGTPDDDGQATDGIETRSHSAPEQNVPISSQEARESQDTSREGVNQSYAIGADGEEAHHSPTEGFGSGVSVPGQHDMNTEQTRSESPSRLSTEQHSGSPAPSALEEGIGVPNTGPQNQSHDAASDSEHRTQTIAKGTSYRSGKLSRKWTILLVFVEAGVVATVTALAIWSAKNNGFASVPQIPPQSSPTITISTFWNHGLLWTAVPTFSMKMFDLMWGTGVDATARRQPYVDLVRHPGKETKTAKKTILPDYQSEPQLYNWVVAFRNRHCVVGASLLLSTVASLVIEPLVAHLFFTAPSFANSSVSITTTSVFNGSAVDSVKSLRPALDLANAIHAYGSSPPAWMTSEYAFLPFTVDDGGTAPGNITADNSAALSGALSCQLLPVTSDTAKLDSSTGELSFSATDRGCPVSASLAVNSSTPSYARSWYVADCPGSEFGRIGVVAGYYNESSPIQLGSPSFVSCIVSYHQTQGSLTVQLDVRGASQPQFIAFDLESDTQIYLESYLTFESTLHSYNTFDPSAGAQVDTFGNTVLSSAQATNTSAPFDPAVIADATATVFATVFAAAALDIFFQPAESNVAPAIAILSTPVTRLYVTWPIAVIVVAIAGLALVCTLSLAEYARRHECMLMEKPVGLLGSAVTLRGSEVLEFVERVKDAMSRGEAKVQEHIEGWYPLEKTRV